MAGEETGDGSRLVAEPEVDVWGWGGGGDSGDGGINRS